MMEYKEGEVIVATPCEHVFHKRCCQEWFQLSRTCPVCRTDVPEAMGLTEGTGSTVGDRRDSTESDRNSNQREGDRVEMNLMHILRREQSRLSRETSNHATSNHSESNAEIELHDVGNASQHSERIGNQSYQSVHIQQLDV